VIGDRPPLTRLDSATILSLRLSTSMDHVFASWPELRAFRSIPGLAGRRRGEFHKGLRLFPDGRREPSPFLQATHKSRPWSVRLLCLGLIMLGEVAAARNSAPQKSTGSETAPGLQQAKLAGVVTQAQNALHHRDYPAAIRLFDELAKRAPAVPEFHANLGMAYYGANRFADAAAQLHEALRLKPSLSNAHYFLGLSLSKAGKCKEAVGYLARDYGRVADPALKRELGMESVRCSMALEQPDQAVDAIRLLSRDFPDDPEALYLSSHVYSDLSTMASERLLYTAPGSLPAHQLNAEVLELQGKPDDAAKEYRKILQSNPNLPGVHYHLGRLLLAGAQSANPQEDARREFEEELKISPADAPSQYELGEIARKARQWNSAIDHFSRALKLDPGLPDALIGLGKTLLSAGRTSEAAAPLEAALRLDPQNAVAHYQLGIAYRRMGHSREADRETAAYQELRQKALSRAEAVAGGITGRVSQQTAEPPE
jgi:tetratricopeptide (TPR) repeat protein